MDTLFRSPPALASSQAPAPARDIPPAPARGVPPAPARGVPPAPARSALFAEDFDLPRRDATPEAEVVNPTYTAAELAETRAEAWAGGLAVGTADTNSTIAATTSALLESIAAALRDANAAASAVAERSAEAIARLLLDSLAKLLPALCERHGEAELCALIRIILPALAQEPTITVRVNPVHTPALMRELDRLDPDLVECVRLVPIEAIAAGNVRVSWHDGSATRDTASLWQQVRAVLEPAGLLSPATAQVSPDKAPAPNSTMAPDPGRASTPDSNHPAVASDSMPAPATILVSTPTTIPATFPATMPTTIPAMPTTVPTTMKEIAHAD
jgi:flagellar biosynthesis/type III secretory pathway protein FliH